MRWTDSIKNKLVASIILLALCLLVLLSNYLDRLHTENVKNSISTMYEDRLIVEGHILKMTRNLYEIREIINTENSERKAGAIRTLTREFKITYDIFVKTRLTKQEKLTADKLLTQVERFDQISTGDNKMALDQTEKILHSLNQLSEIQLDESKLIMKQVESQYVTIKSLSQFAFGIIIIILIVLQILVFSGETIIPLFKPKDPRLN